MFEYDKMIKNRTFLKIPKSRFSLLILCLIFVLGACGPADEEENSNDNASPVATGYPAVSETVYPPIGPISGPDESVYPPPLATDKPRFQLDLPLTAGDTTVSGQTPESLSLAIVDITFGGVILGTGQSDEDGRFSITVTPLPEGHRVGVTITEIEPGITFEELAEKYFPYRGEGFRNVPNVGIFYDTAMTQP